MNVSRRGFIQAAGLATLLPLVPRTAAADEEPESAGNTLHRNLPSMVAADGGLRFDFGDEVMIYDGGEQPYMLCTASGALIVQAQAIRRPVDTPRMHYPSAIDTAISRDLGRTWSIQTPPAGTNGLNVEGGAIQTRNGEILALDTYVTPGAQPETGAGWLFSSRDDWQTLQGPEEITFELPGVTFQGSSDDGGRPYAAQRLHRRILEMPNGDLVTTLYGVWTGDHTPSTYEKRMMKTRTLFLRSSNRGRHWKLVSTVAVDPSVGTEGFGEPVIARIAEGPGAGRLVCHMRTGRNLYESFSEDEGATWSKPAPRIFAGLDVDRTEMWVDMFRHMKGHSGRPLDENNPDELRGAVVDPDLIVLPGGLLASSFGVRIPQKACWEFCQHPWNGNYLAVSTDGGQTWPNVVRLTSGVMTTHYTAIEALPGGKGVFMSYDFGNWHGTARYAYGRTISITVKHA